MKRAIKKQSNLYSYLKPYLATGDEAAITSARKEYWKKYQAAWKREKRAQQKIIELSFTKPELKIIKDAAGKNNRSLTSFVKNAALCYCEKKYLAPDQRAYNNIREALIMLYHKLKDFEEEKKVTPATVHQLLQVFNSTEKLIQTHIQQPETLEEKLIEVIHDNPEYKATILHLIQTT